MAKLYLITDDGLSVEENLNLFSESLLEGCGMFQLRLKDQPDERLYRVALEFSRRCHAVGVPFIVNDRLDLALAAGAEGVHLGESDLPLGVARRIVGDGLLIGATVRDTVQAEQAQSAGVSYLACGPCFATQTKPELEPVGLRAVARVIDHSELPVCAIGGINTGNLAEVLEVRPSYVSLVTAVSRAVDPLAVKERLLRFLDVDEHNLRKS